MNQEEISNLSLLIRHNNGLICPNLALIQKWVSDDEI